MAASRRAEQSTLKRFGAILDNTVDGLITIDEAGIVQSFNAGAESIFGYAANEVIGQNVKMLMPEPHRSAHDQYLENSPNMQSAKVIGTGREVEGRHKDGTIFPAELAVTEIMIGGQTLYVGVLRDIT